MQVFNKIEQERGKNQPHELFSIDTTAGHNFLPFLTQLTYFQIAHPSYEVLNDSEAMTSIHSLSYLHTRLSKYFWTHS